jgi:DNA-binding NarL/FixJ family response regulator
VFGSLTEFLASKLPDPASCLAIRRPGMGALDFQAELARANIGIPSSGIRALFETLSPREREVIALVTSGLMNKQVAAKLGSRNRRWKVRRGRVMGKMGAKSLADLIKMSAAT